MRVSNRHLTDHIWLLFNATYVESLCRPEHQNREEVRAGDEGDDQCETENARLLPQSFGEHWELSSITFPDEESYEERNAEDERYEHVCRAPWVLVSVSGVSNSVSG